MEPCPPHYDRGFIEPWDYIRDKGLSYHLGCAIKYISRAGYKDSKAEDLRKAIHYLENELQHTLNEPEPQRPSGRVPYLVRRDEWGDESFDAETFDR